MTEKELMIKTAETLKGLLSERDTLLEKIAQQQLALDVTKKMIDFGKLSTEEVLPKYAELTTKTKEELEIISKAMEYAQDINIFKLGTVSDSKSHESEKDRFMNFLMEE